MNDDGHIQRLADEITRYLRAHPNAADTEDGVIRWWLGNVSRAESLPYVHPALAMLIERGDVSTRELAGGGRLYAAGPRIQRRENSDATH